MHSVGDQLFLLLTTRNALNRLYSNIFMRSGFIFIILSLSKGNIRLTGKFKPVIKKAMVELDGNISGNNTNYYYYVLHSQVQNFNISFICKPIDKASY